VERLVARQEIDDCKPRVDEGDLRRLVDPDAASIRSTVIEDVENACDGLLREDMAKRTENPAHPAIAPAAAMPLAIGAAGNGGNQITKSSGWGVAARRTD
jgi:hypothetical protein